MEYQSTTTAQTSDQLPSLRELLYVVMLRKAIVAAIFSTVIVVAAILVFGVISPKYEASATVIINVSQLAMPIVDGIPSDFEKLSTFQTQKDVIKSVVVASKVVDQLNLQETHILSNIEKAKRWLRDVRRTLGSWFGIERWQKPEDPRAAAIDAVYTRLEIVSKPESQALKISYSAHSAKEAKDTLKTIIEQYSNYYYARFQERAEGMRSYLETRVQDSNRKLASSEAAILEFRQRDRIDMTDSGSAQAQYANPNRPGFVGLTDNPQVQSEIKLNILSMEKDLQKLRTLYAEADPEIQDLRARIKRYTSALGQLPNKEVEWLRLKREQEANQDVAQNLRRNLERASMFAESSTDRIQVIQIIDPASADDEPVSPKPRLAMILAIVCGLLFSIMSAFVLDYLDPNIRSVRDAERSVGLKVLGSLSRL